MPNQTTRKTDPQLLSISDFSPGIIQRTGVLGALSNSPSPLGAASIQNTYRCIALPGGGLGPLPRKTSDLHFTDHSTANLPANTTAALTGFKIVGPLYQKLGVTAPQYPLLSVTPFELHIGYEYINGANQIQTWRKYPYYSADGSVPIHSVTTPTSGTAQQFSPMSFVVTRMYHPDPTIAGYVVVVGSWVLMADTPVINTSYCMIYPDPTNDTTSATDTPYDLTSLYAGLGLGHQNRYVALFRGENNHGANGVVSVFNEYIKYTFPNDYTIDGSGSVAFGMEHPNGYGAFGSLTSSDLLLIKHAGGAFLVQGDLNNPIVRHYPSVTPTGGVECIGTDTPFGFCYLVHNDSIYSWGGGDSSSNLAPQLEDGFWQVSGNLTYRFGGGLAPWGDGLVAPNNFLFDGKAWWRFEDPALGTYYMFDKDPINNVMYCARPTFSDSNTIFASSYDLGLPATNFSWQSQPLTFVQRRRQRIRGVYLTAQGAGTVTITITPTDNDTVISQPSVPVISTNGPTRVKLGCNVIASEFTLRIQSDGGGNAAPIVYQVDLEVEEASNVTVQ